MDLLTSPTKGMEDHHKRRFKMTAIKNINMKEYCNTLYNELDVIKSRIGKLIEQIEDFQGEDREHVGSHADQLREIIKTIEWKLEIIGKACPIDSTRFSEGAVGGVSVPAPEISDENERLAGGVAGG